MAQFGIAAIGVRVFHVRVNKEGVCIGKRVLFY